MIGGVLLTPTTLILHPQSDTTIVFLERLSEKKRIDLYTYKLAGIIKSDSASFISLINQDGEIITVSMFEEVSDGVKLVDMTTKEAVFATEDKYLIMNFKNQIKEQSEY